MRQATKSEVRTALGHGEGNRRVRISRDGRVTYYGSRDEMDRSHDYWHEGLDLDDYRVDGVGVVIL